MAIEAIGRSAASYAAMQAQMARVEEKALDEKNTQDAEAKKAVDQNEDKFVKSATADAGAYTKNKLTRLSANQMMELEEQRVNSFQNMLRSMVVQQGQQSNLTLFGVQLNVTPEASAKAKEAISEGGMYSVDAVAGRIMDMAKALSGGNDSKIDLLRGAVEKGFKAAGVDLGGKLPDISNKTYDEVMKRFDDWEKESKTAEDTGAAAE